MAIVDVGMTQEQVMASLEPLPAGPYTVVYKGLLKTEEGEVLWPTRKGGRMIKAMFGVVDPDPSKNGRGLIYPGTLGSFSFALLVKNLPIMVGGGIDDEAGIGTELRVDVSVRKGGVDANTGREYEPSNQIDKFHAV